jgi:hypothetical protein
MPAGIWGEGSLFRVSILALDVICRKRVLGASDLYLVAGDNYERAHQAAMSTRVVLLQSDPCH